MAQTPTILFAADLLRQIEAITPTLQAGQRITLVAEQELVCTPEIGAGFHGDARGTLAFINKCLREAIAQTKIVCEARRVAPR